MTRPLGVMASAVHIAAGGFDPLTAITWAAVYWASDPSWSNPGDGNAIVTWRDASAGARDLAPAANAPTFRASVANLNNQPAVEFDGTNDYLITGSSVSVSQPFTIIGIADSFTPSSDGRFVCNRANNNVQTYRQVLTTGYTMFAGTSEISAGTLATSGGAMFAWVFNGASSKIINGATVNNVATPGANALAGVILGARIGGGTPNFFAAFKAAFVGVYSGDITANGNWSGFKTWANTLYGVTT
jgi:hypothetical protein